MPISIIYINIEREKDNMKAQVELVKKAEKTQDPFDAVLQSMQERIITWGVSIELDYWVWLLMHLENAYLIKKDDSEIEITAAAFAYAFEHPCQKESENEVLVAVNAIKEKIITRAIELGIGEEISPKTLIPALKTGKISRLQEYIYEQTR